MKILQDLFVNAFGDHLNCYAAAVSKIMRLQDLVTVAAKIRVVTRFRNTLGLAGRLSTRLQPNHPTDDPVGTAASIIDGLTYLRQRRRNDRD